MINIEAPIIPWDGIGGIHLYTNISELRQLIEEQGGQPKFLGKFLIKYEINNLVEIWFNVLNGKLFKITALSNYTGKLFEKISIGMPIDDVLKIEPSFEYDEFEEVYCSSKGIYIETDPVEHTVLWISVYTKEVDDQDFEKGNW